VTIGRLRKLLGEHDAILVSGNKMSLNRAKCWVDTWYIQSIQADSHHGILDDAALANRWLATYKGTFLQEDGDASWVLLPRMRWRSQFLEQMDRLGTKLEQAQEWQTALACYQRALLADDLAEQFYQGAIRCHAAMGQVAEGMSAFRRLKQTLSVVLGVAPSAATLALAAKLRDGATRV
jgi:DNA-binding SARP family transcriptional activator